MNITVGVSKIKVAVNNEAFKQAAVETVQSLSGHYITQVNKFALKKTGALRNSAYALNTPTGISIQYGVPYAEFVYHNPRIHNVTTPGTTSYWDTRAEADTDGMNQINAEFIKKMSKKVDSSFFTVTKK